MESPLFTVHPDSEEASFYCPFDFREASFSLYYIKPERVWQDSNGVSSFSLYYIKHAQDLQGLSRAQPALAGHRHSQSAPLPFLLGRAQSSVRDGPELRHGQT